MFVASLEIPATIFYANLFLTNSNLMCCVLDADIDLAAQQRLCPIKLLPEDFRLTTKPIPPSRLPTWQLCKEQEQAYWQVHDVKMHTDFKDWQSLSGDERRFIKMVLAFFASSDNLVNINLLERFLHDIPIPEFKRFYTFQAAMENIHAEMYSIMIEELVKDPEEQTPLFKAVQNFPSIRRKAEWAVRWIESRDSFAHRLLGMLINEGLFFQGSFCAIYWLRERGVMKGLCQANDYIAKDEKRHCEFACHGYNQLLPEFRLSVEDVHAMFREGLECEVEFIVESLPCRLLGMNSDAMVVFLKHVTNFWLAKIGYSPLYPNAYNPFAFMDMLSIPNKSSFFEVTPTEYDLGGGDVAERDSSGKLVISYTF